MIVSLLYIYNHELKEGFIYYYYYFIILPVPFFFCLFVIALTKSEKLLLKGSLSAENITIYRFFNLS